MRWGPTITVAIALASAGCDSFYAVHGRVRSCADHRPLDGALVHLSDGVKGDLAKTDTDGAFVAALNEPDGDGPSRLTVAKKGWRTEEHAVANPHLPQDVCLQPEGP